MTDNTNSKAEKLKVALENLDKTQGFHNYILDYIDAQEILNDEMTGEQLCQELTEKGFCDVDIIYYSTAMEYLRENDPSLRESLCLAYDFGYTAENLNSETLASILATDTESDLLWGCVDEIDNILADF